MTLLLNGNPNPSLGTPIFVSKDATFTFDGGSAGFTGGGAFAAVHYGGGAGGGSFEFFAINPNCTTAILFPQNADGTFNPDPFNAKGGGISTVTVFKSAPVSVPDNGSTAMLLGAALTGLGLARRYLKR